MNGEKPSKIDLKELKNQAEISIHNLNIGIAIEKARLDGINLLINKK